MKPPPYPLSGVVSWNMNTTCGYRCSYCTQRFLDNRKQWARDIPAFLDGFARLPGDWEVKLSGGEPFLHPAFERVISSLIEQKRTVSVVTNFSAPQDELAEYARLTAPRAGVFSASLHLEFTTPDGFLDKLRAFAQLYKGPVVTTCVATRANLPLLPTLQKRWAEAGLSFNVQPEKQDRAVIDYSPGERAQILSLGGHNGTQAIDPSFFQKPCWAGARYFVLDHRGAAWRCYPARKQKTEFLGNFLDKSFRLMTGANPCGYHYCNCTVPIARGMVQT